MAELVAPGYNPLTHPGREQLMTQKDPDGFKTTISTAVAGSS